MRKGKIFIGTSGWVYSHWEGIFYPKELGLKDKLKYFSKHFKTVEVNYSFYRLPRPTTYQNWYSQTPGDFLFAIKVSRFITHIKRLKGVKDAWKIFIKNTLNLKEKLGPILFQFPPNLKATEENVKRLVGTIGWGAVGAALLGPVGLLAGLLAGGRGKSVTFVCKLKDGRRFLASAPSKVYIQMSAAIFK